VPSRTILADPDQALDASGSSGPAWSAAVGIDYDGVVQVLEAEGVEKFDASGRSLAASAPRASGSVSVSSSHEFEVVAACGDDVLQFPDVREIRDALAGDQKLCRAPDNPFLALTLTASAGGRAVSARHATAVSTPPLVRWRSEPATRSGSPSSSSVDHRMFSRHSPFARPSATSARTARVQVSTSPGCPDVTVMCRCLGG
jgi:hypothetical protein